MNDPSDIDPSIVDPSIIDPSDRDDSPSAPYDPASEHADGAGSCGDDAAHDGDGAAPSPRAAQASPGDDAPSDSDETLLSRIAEHRDRAAFKQFFARYGTRVKAFMIRSGAAHDMADEAAQETMLAVWRRAETFDPDRASAAAWLFAIARNKRVDLLRRGARPEPDPDDPSLRPDPDPTPFRSLSAARRDAAVREALTALTDEQREVVTLSFYEGCAHSEISERLGVPLGTVKSRLRLAFGKLRGALGASFRDELTED